MYIIPMVIMRGHKAQPADFDGSFTVAADWPWVETAYALDIALAASQIASIEIDPAKGMADLDRSNNRVELDAAILFQR